MQSAEIVPLYSSLGDKRKTLSQKIKIKKEKQRGLKMKLPAGTLQCREDEGRGLKRLKMRQQEPRKSPQDLNIFIKIALKRVLGDRGQ